MDKETAFVYLENKRIAMNSIVCDTRNIFRSSRKVQFSPIRNGKKALIMS